ncbi:hypothetical protein V5799_018198 [Amblyomma americanum]|uniref:M13 family peptidase n=1 Tax=Amblyomma americanum TaxID=6943 RepID=A0AAQ4F124_AMBAM
MDEIVHLEEIKEEEETTRLERELLLGELWRRSNRRDFALTAEGAGRNVIQFQDVLPPIEETEGTTARDSSIHFILHPLDSRSEVFFVQDATDGESLLVDEVLGNEKRDEQRPAWHRRRCSAVDVQEPSPKNSGTQRLSAHAIEKRREDQSVKSRESTTGGAFPGPFSKQFSWNSAFFLPRSASRYTQEETERTKARQVGSTLRDVCAPSRRRSSVKVTARKSPRGSGRLAQSDDLAATEVSRTSDDANQSEPCKSPGLFASQSKSTTQRPFFSTDLLTSFFSGGSTSFEKEQGRTAGAGGQTTGLLSTIFLTSTLEENERVMPETGEHIQYDVQASEQESSNAKAASKTKSSNAISSTQFETAAGESTMQANKSEAPLETEEEALKEGGTESAVAETSADASKVAQTSAIKTLDTFQAAPNLVSETVVVASLSPSTVTAQKSPVANSRFSEGAEEIEEPASPPPPAPKEVETNAAVAGSPPLEAPVEVFSANSVVCVVTCLVVFWVVVVFIWSQSVPGGDQSTRTTTTATTSTTVGFSAYLCNTKPCLREGDYLKQLLNGAERPCTNFYRYVCERWSPGPIATASQPDILWSRDTILEREMEAEAIKYVTSNPESVRPIQALLQACNDRLLASSSVAEMRLLFRRWKIDEWPLPAYTSRPWDDVWILAGDLLRDVGLAALVDVFLARDPSGDQRAVIAIDLPEPLHFPHLGAMEWPLIRSALQETLSLFDITDNSDVEKFLNDSSAVFDVVEVLYQSASFDETEVVNLSELESSLHKLITYATRSNTTGQNDQEHHSDVRVLLIDPRFARALTASLRPLPTSALLNHLGFRALVRLAAFLPDSLSFLRQLSFLEAAGRSEKPDTMSLCLRTLERAAPGCFSRALSAPLHHSGAAALRRNWLSDLETVLLRALPRLPWLDGISIAAVAERIRRLHLDTAFFDGATRGKDNISCAALDIRVLHAPIEALVEVFRRRPLTSVGSWRRTARALETWPTLDLPSGSVLHVPAGLVNGSVPANESLFAFHLARVAVRFYAAVAPVLHADSAYYRSFPLSERSERNVQQLLACMSAGGWHQWAAPAGSNRDVWLRRWLLDQTLALELGLHSFRELSAPGRVWKLDQRFANLAHVDSKQLFFVYYALDHCELRGSGENQSRRELLLRRRLPAAARVNLPLRNLPAFTEAFGCSSDDALAARSPCTLFQH